MTTAALILTKDQAQAVYDAMSALRKAGVTRFSGIVPGKNADGSSNYIEVVQMSTGDVVIEKRAFVHDLREHHVYQSAFAAAYGLQ